MTGRAAQKAESVKLVVLDVDGVMTDGTLLYGTDTHLEMKSFNIKDGLRHQAFTAVRYRCGDYYRQNISRR